MRLRKWCTNSSELMSSIPEELRKSKPLQLGSILEGCPKALGVHWQVKNDHLYVATPPPLKTSTPTNCQVTSQTAKVYDVFGLFAPITVNARGLSNSSGRGRYSGTSQFLMIWLKFGRSGIPNCQPSPLNPYSKS